MIGCEKQDPDLRVRRGTEILAKAEYLRSNNIEEEALEKQTVKTCIVVNIFVICGKMYRVFH